MLLHRRLVLLDEYRGQSRRHHVLAAFRHHGQEVEGKLHAAALSAADPAAVRHGPLEIGVAVAYHKLYA